MPSLLTVVSNTARRLADARIPNARKEAEWLALETLGLTPKSLTQNPDVSHHSPKLATLAERAARRTTGEPLQYILGTVDFRGLTLEIGPGVLIPRPETEQLVEHALALAPDATHVCDMCTGSAAIAMALARNLPTNARLVAVDISQHALNFARKNLRRHGTHNIHLVQSNLFDALPPGKPFDLITANPPYIAAHEYDTLDPQVKNHEPKIALNAGPGGLDVITRLIADAYPQLQPNAPLVLEIGETQRDAVLNLLKHHHYRHPRIEKDLASRYRIAIGIR